MANPLGSLLRFILPLGIAYLAFSFLGPVGGVLILAAFILFYAYFNRGIIYQNRASKKYHRGDYDGALNDLKTALNLDSKAFRIRSTYAFLLLKLGHNEEAAVQIDEALKGARVEIDRNTMRVTKALVLWKQNKLDEALSELTDLIKTYENTNVYSTLGFLYIEKGDMEKALEFNLMAKDYNSSSPIILDNLGTTYLMMGDYDKAFETYQEVMKNKPNFPEAFYNYAKVLEKKDDIEKALYMVRHALTLRFWNTSTVSKEEVEAYLNVLESKEKALEEEFKMQKAQLAAVEEVDGDNQ